MRKIIVTNKYNNKKLNNYILSIFPNLSTNILFRALRQKDIKVNGKRIKENILVFENDVIEIFVSDELLFGIENINFEVIYEDENILVINKPINISVTEEANGNLGPTLTRLIKEKFGNNIQPCHRLDRNTKRSSFIC